MKVIDPGLFEVIVGGTGGKSDGAAPSGTSCSQTVTDATTTIVCESEKFVTISKCLTQQHDWQISIGPKIAGVSISGKHTSRSCQQTTVDKNTGSVSHSSSNNPLEKAKKAIQLPELQYI